MNIQIKSNHPDWIQILVDGELWREGHRLILGRRLCFPPDIDSLARLEVAYAEKEYSGAKRYVLWRLARSAQSSLALRKSLQERGVSESAQQRIVDFLITSGLIDDEDYVQRFVICEQARGRGPAVIRAKLRQKGIPLDQIDAALRPVDEGEQQKSIVRLLETRYRRYDLSDRRERNKVMASLVRRGFSFDAIRRLFS